MLIIRPTPQWAGISISGDFLDLQNLYDAISEIVGDEAEPGSEYEMTALQILGLCYDLRQAWSGNRSVEFVDNGLDATVRQKLKTLGPQHNVYFQVRIFLPQILFAVMALCDFIEISSRKVKIPAFDRSIQMVQFFQSEVVSVLMDAMESNTAKLFASQVYGKVPRYRSFCTQYVDLLTERYLAEPREKRLLQLLQLARRFNELGSDYRLLVEELTETAAELNCQIADLETISEPPELSSQEW